MTATKTLLHHTENALIGKRHICLALVFADCALHGVQFMLSSQKLFGDDTVREQRFELFDALVAYQMRDRSAAAEGLHALRCSGK